MKDGKHSAALAKYEEGLYIIDKCREAQPLSLACGLRETQWTVTSNHAMMTSCPIKPGVRCLPRTVTSYNDVEVGFTSSKAMPYLENRGIVMMHSQGHVRTCKSLFGE